MILFIILGILLGALSVIFALQNITSITVVFLSWHLSGSLAVILFIAIIAGVLMSLLISMPGLFKNYLIVRDLKRQNRVLQDEVASYKVRVAETQKAASATTLKSETL